MLAAARRRRRPAASMGLDSPTPEHTTRSRRAGSRPLGLNPARITSLSSLSPTIHTRTPDADHVDPAEPTDIKARCPHSHAAGRARGGPRKLCDGWPRVGEGVQPGPDDDVISGRAFQAGSPGIASAAPAHPSQCICARQRPGASIRIRIDPNRLLYFRAVLFSASARGQGTLSIPTDE